MSGEFSNAPGFSTFEKQDSVLLALSGGVDSAVTAHILRHAEPGSVILMHDLTDSSVTAALRVIDALQAQGYEFLTVSELAARSGTALRPGQAYCSFPP